MKLTLVLLLVQIACSDAFQRPQKKRQRLMVQTSEDTLVRNDTSQKFKDVDDMLHEFKENPALLIFTSINCGPCRLQKKELKKLTEMVMQLPRLIAIDTDKWPQVGSKFNVGKLPCLILMKDGKEWAKFEGLALAEDIQAQLQSM